MNAPAAEALRHRPMARFGPTAVFHTATLAMSVVTAAGATLPFTDTLGDGTQPAASVLPAAVILLTFLGVTAMGFHRATERSAARLPRRGGAELAARGVGLGVAVLVVALLVALHVAAMSPLAMGAYVVVVPVVQWVIARVSGPPGPVPGSLSEGDGGGWPVAQAVDLLLGGIAGGALFLWMGTGGREPPPLLFVAAALLPVIAIAGAVRLAMLRVEAVPAAGPDPVRGGGGWSFPPAVAALTLVTTALEVIHEFDALFLIRENDEEFFEGLFLFLWSLLGVPALIGALGLAVIFIRRVRSWPYSPRGAAIARLAGLLPATAMLFLVPGVSGLEGAALSAVYLTVTLAGVRLAARPGSTPVPAHAARPASAAVVDLVMLGVLQAGAWLLWPLPDRTDGGMSLTEEVFRPPSLSLAAGCLAVGLAGALVLLLLGRGPRDGSPSGAEA